MKKKKEQIIEQIMVEKKDNGSCQGCVILITPYIPQKDDLFLKTF